MSALNFALQDNIVLIATDTLALSAETHKPSHFQTKLYPVPHLAGIICGTGLSQFVAQWALQVHTSMLAKSIPHLDEFTPDQLRRLWKDYQSPIVETSTIYHFGYDKDLKRFRGFVYRSEREFVSEELSYGFGTKPPIPSFRPSDNAIDDFYKVISIQRDEDLSRSPENRIGIGGDIHITMLEPDRITILHSHRFEDYDELYDKMCDELPVNKSGF